MIRIFFTFVHSGTDEDGHQSEVPSGNEHHRHTKKGAQGGQGPVEVLEGRTPAGCFEQGLEGTGGIDAQIAHEEELGDQGGDVLDDRDQDAQPADAQGQEDGADGLAAGVRLLEGTQEGNHIVGGERLEKTRSASQGLHSGTDGGRTAADLKKNERWGENIGRPWKSDGITGQNKVDRSEAIVIKKRIKVNKIIYQDEQWMGNGKLRDHQTPHC